MDLEQDLPPDLADDETPVQTGEADDGATDAPEPQEPAGRSEGRSRHDDGMVERLRSVEAQARVYQEESERNRRELETLRAAQRVDPREEQARLEAMDPEQRITYIFEKQQRDSQSQVAQIEQRTNAQIDQLKFDAQLDKTASSLGWSTSQRAKYADEIERMYTGLAQRNMTIPRGDLLKHKLGDELMTSGAKAIKGAGDKGKANIARQAARMTPAASNVTGKSAGKTKAQESMDRMLQAGVLEI